MSESALLNQIMKITVKLFVRAQFQLLLDLMYFLSDVSHVISKADLIIEPINQ